MMARIADDNDFDSLRNLIDDNAGWQLELSTTKTHIEVWTKPVQDSEFNMVKIKAYFDDVTADCIFDVLHDPDYRKEWDAHMMASSEIGVINVNNDIGYYAMSCPTPLKPRDFVLMRSWLDTGPNGEQMLLSRSVSHENHPPKKGFIRALTHLTGFVIRTKGHGCTIGYVAHCDPQGKLPPWLVNKVTHSLGPKMVKDLRKAAIGYIAWKSKQLIRTKPWRFPEEGSSPRISLDNWILYEVSSSAAANVKDDLCQSNTNGIDNNTNLGTKPNKSRKIPRDSRKLKLFHKT